MSHSVFIVAAERSGDDLGAGLIEQLRHQGPRDLQIFGIGGTAMAALGVESDIDISPLSVFGFTEGLMALPTVYDRVRQTVELIMQKAPGVVVLIDSWGFTMRVAQRLRKAGYHGKVIKYVAPQVFATRAGRAKTLAEGVDHLMTIHNFDAPYFERHGLSVSYVGNPVFDMDYRSGDGSALRSRLQIPKDSLLIGVFFGSRLSEIQRLAKPFADAIELIRANRRDVHFVSPVSSNIAEDVLAAAASDQRLQDIIFLPEAEKLDVFDAIDISLACSGTVTTQLACAGVPTVVAYRLSALTYFFGKYMLKTDYISLVNIAADKALFPEYIQKDANGGDLSKAVLNFLDNESLSMKVSADLLAHTAMMRGEGGIASARAAKDVLNFL